MKILLIVPNLKLKRLPFYFMHYHQPLGLSYIAAVLREDGHTVRVADALAENMSDENVLSIIEEFHPDLIGITTNISNSYKACVIAAHIRLTFPKIPVVMGGPWATTEYEYILNKRFATYIVIGEGEITIKELCEKLQERAGSDELWKVKGIAFKDPSGRIIKTPRRPLIEDLDSIPFPAWDLFPSYRKYPFLHRKEPYFPIMTTRGCPMDCNHCTKVVHGYKYRKRSWQNVISELYYLKRNFGLGQIFIVDDTFTLDRKRTLKIFDEIIKRGFNINIFFSNGVRADTIDHKMAKKMKEAGVIEVALGIESGNQNIVNKIGKKLDLKKVENAVRLLKKFKINTMGFFIFGHPWDDFNTMTQTYRFAKKLDLDHPFFFRAMAFPGTRLYDLVKREGKFIRDKKNLNFESYNLGEATFEIWNLKTKDLNKAFKRYYVFYFLRPQKIIKLMRSVKSYYEVKCLFRGFFDFLYNYIDKIIIKLFGLD
ncbi:MAG: B12-binding domain-containing radical SAM protein [Promethearchaeota archaeon]